ncbi:MAG: DNA-processing protein DprA [Anaerolineae bacterium]
MTEHKYWLGFSLVPGIGTKRTLNLLNKFGQLSSAWKANETQLLEAGLEAQPTHNLLQFRKKIDLERELARVERVKAWLLTFADANYPSLLKQIADPPLVLYVRGTLTPQDERALCIVGTRKASVSGRDTAYAMATQLAQNDITIISGLAQGIDEAAHRGALDGGGRTVAVSACGINTIYPEQHIELAHQIVESGAVITEFPIGTPPIRGNFPRRNRIMSGMALGVVVVEAPEKSGALITANVAAEQGRDVFAIPGNILNPASSGTNRLIQDGAKLVMSVKDILDELDITQVAVQSKIITEMISPANDTEATILQFLGADPIHIDEIVRQSGLPTAVVSSTLTILELKGLAQMVGAMQYNLIHKRL